MGEVFNVTLLWKDLLMLQLYPKPSLWLDTICPLSQMLSAFNVFAHPVLHRHPAG